MSWEAQHRYFTHQILCYRGEDQVFVLSFDWFEWHSFFIMTSVSLLSLRLVFSSLFHFGKVLDVITPPYTSDFVQLFLPILENDSIAGTIRTEGEHDPVAEFIGELFLKWKYAWWDGTRDVFSLSISKRDIILSRGTMTCGAYKCNSELCRFMLVTLGY